MKPPTSTCPLGVFVWVWVDGELLIAIREQNEGF